MTNHANVAGTEVSFPLWVKTLSWMVGLCFPVAVGLGAWMAAAMVDLKVTVAGMAPKLEEAVKDRYRGETARAVHAVIEADITEIKTDVRELQRREGIE